MIIANAPTQAYRNLLLKLKPHPKRRQSFRVRFNIVFEIHFGVKCALLSLLFSIKAQPKAIVTSKTRLDQAKNEINLAGYRSFLRRAVNAVLR